MDSNKRKSNWRRIQERYRGVSNAYERQEILRDAILAIETEHGTSAAELIYPYEKLIELHHELGEYKFAAMLLPLYYLALEMNSVEEPERLLAAIEKMRERGYLSEAINACCRLVYLLYESRGVKKGLVDDAWYLLDELHTQHPDMNAKKLLKHLQKK